MFASKAIPGLTQNHQTRPERVAKDKHSSLLDLFISDKEKSFIIFDPSA
jgi:hypothetical protein